MPAQNSWALTVEGDSKGPSLLDGGWVWGGVAGWEIQQSCPSVIYPEDRVQTEPQAAEDSEVAQTREGRRHSTSGEPIT